MIRSLRTLTASLACLFLCSAALAQDGTKDKPIRALLITGGCCHDYTNQKKIISEGITARSKLEIKWTIVQQGGSTTNTKIPVYNDPKWADNYDIVIHNECFAHVDDPKWTQRILKPHKEGKPAMVLHCAMHCYRDKTDEWFKFCGVTSHRHGAHYPFEAINISPDHPIMKRFGKKWKTPQGELYLISKVWPSATPLAHAMSKDTKKNEVCIWTNEYGKGKVFGTTIGHHNETMSSDTYLDFLTRGFMWSIGKLDEKDLREAIKDVKVSEAKWKDNSPKVTKLVPENLALNKKATAQGSQDGHDPSHAIDDDLSTRWCGPNGNSGYWWQVDLGKTESLTGVNITWEFETGHYLYTIAGSTDGKTWQTLVDRSKTNKTGAAAHQHKFKADNIRFVRITTHKQQPGAWISFFEFEVLGTKMIEKEVSAATSPNAKKYLAGVTAPKEFDINLFAAPPQVNYPVCMTATADGVVFIGVDPNGSLGKTPGLGHIARCVDTDGDGVADDIKTFAKVMNPRGLHFENNKLWVLHPPDFSVFHDDNGDGVADRQETLIKGISTPLFNKQRGADHTTNGIRMGLDGWLYIAVGDFGFIEAETKHGQKLQLFGGGVARVRPDGTNLEIYTRGTRNICDIAIDYQHNIFARDNTNDGGGWDVRLHHLNQNAHQGYPSHYKHFADEHIKPLADYGGGSGTGALYAYDKALGDTYKDSLFTVDWGRGAIYRHPLERDRATFKAKEETFVKIPRPTDMDMDGNGNLYIASWKNGKFAFSGPDVGFIAVLKHKDYAGTAMPDVPKLDIDGLIKLMQEPSYARQFAANRELINRSSDRAAKTNIVNKLEAIIPDINVELNARHVAIWTLKEIQGADAHPFFIKQLEGPQLRAALLRALTDRPEQLANVPLDPFVHTLKSYPQQPDSQLAAIIGLGRLGKLEAAEYLLPFTVNDDPTLSHAAVKSLVQLRAIDACLASVAKGSSELHGALRVLREIHDVKVVDGLIDIHNRNTDAKVQRDLLTSLIRLYHREGEWDGRWWGTRPDTTGPYYRRVEWEPSQRIGVVVGTALQSADGDLKQHIVSELQRHRVNLGNTTKLIIAMTKKDPAFAPKALDMLLGGKSVPAEALPLLKELASTGNADVRIRAIDGLLSINSKESLEAAIEAVKEPASPQAESDWSRARQSFIANRSNNKRADLFIELTGQPDAARNTLGYAVLLNIAKQKRLNAHVKASIEATFNKALSATQTSPGSTVAMLHAIGEMKSKDHDALVRNLMASDKLEIKTAATTVAKQLNLITSRPAGSTLENMTVDAVLAKLLDKKGDVKLGEKLFTKVGCAACHTTSSKQTPKGPFLGDIGKRYSRKEITQSIIQPNAVIAQGFATHWFETEDGDNYDGFISREAGDEVEIRNAAGVAIVIKKKDIFERGTRKSSMMPQGLVKDLTPDEFVALLTYLESLKSK